MNEQTKSDSENRATAALLTKTERKLTRLNNKNTVSSVAVMLCSMALAGGAAPLGIKIGAALLTGGALGHTLYARQKIKKLSDTFNKYMNTVNECLAGRLHNTKKALTALGDSKKADLIAGTATTLTGIGGLVSGIDLLDTFTIATASGVALHNVINYDKITDTLNDYLRDDAQTYAHHINDRSSDPRPAPTR